MSKKVFTADEIYVIQTFGTVIAQQIFDFEGANISRTMSRYGKKAATSAEAAANLAPLVKQHLEERKAKQK
ncbi:MAG: hypothetical protein ACRDBF_14665 [Plesiomonas shigelloides]